MTSEAADLAQPVVRLCMTYETWMVLWSAANEASIFKDAERQATSGPSKAEAEEVLASVRFSRSTPAREPHVVVLPRTAAAAALSSIEACLQLFDAAELEMRTMETVQAFGAARDEIDRLLIEVGVRGNGP